jgi:hypothetical protein
MVHAVTGFHQKANRATALGKSQDTAQLALIERSYNSAGHRLLCGVGNTRVGEIGCHNSDRGESTDREFGTSARIHVPIEHNNNYSKTIQNP